MKSDFLHSFAKELDRVNSDDIIALSNAVLNHKKIIIIGNGGSNSIASHISQDYTKFLKRQAISFSDPSRLTCYINDFGMDDAYKIFLEQFSDKDTLAILISSSGNSTNIYNCCMHCRVEGIPYITLTGFDANNRVRSSFGSSAVVDFWVDSNSFGIVECLHQVILHAIL